MGKQLKILGLISIFLISLIAVFAVPSITITYPSNGATIISSNNITINATITDTTDLVNASLFVGGILNQTISLTGNNTNVSFTLTELNDTAYTFYLTALNNISNTTTTNSQTFTIDFINDAPILSSIGDQSAPTNLALSVTASAADSNSDTLTYSISTSEAGVSINPASGLITYTPSALKNFTVSVSVSDGRGGTDSETFSVEIRNPKAGMSVSTPSFPESDRDINSSATFTITNSGDYDLSNITLTHTLASKFKTTFTGLPSNLSVGQSSSVSLSVFLPEKLDSGKISIGSFSVFSDLINATGVSIAVNPKNELILNDLDFLSKFFEDYDNWENDEDKVIKIHPGDDMIIDLDVKNTFSTSDNYDWDIEDIEITITIEEIDYGDDIEYEFEPFDLRAKEQEKNLHFEFSIPYSVENTVEYPITILLEADDENGALHTFEWTGELEGERVKDQLKFKDSLNLIAQLINWTVIQ